MDRYPLHTTCKLMSANRTYSGYTNDLSEGGASVTLMTEDIARDENPVILEFLEHNFSIEAKVCRATSQQTHSHLSLEFPNITVEQNRQLVTMLYSDMTWWKQRKQPGNLDVFFALLASFLNLTPLRSKYGRSNVAS
jgi:cellulose synthase (UDP-forming)